MLPPSSRVRRPLAIAIITLAATILATAALAAAARTHGTTARRCCRLLPLAPRFTSNAAPAAAFLLHQQQHQHQQIRRRFLSDASASIAPPSAAAATPLRRMTAPSAASSSSSSTSAGAGGVNRAKVITDVAAAGQRLREGGLVAFPTETVYGLGASAYDEAAVRRIFEVKGRPLTDPLIAHVAEPEQAWAVFQCGGDDTSSSSSSTPQGQSKERQLLGLLGQTFWPGPLTLVAPAAKAIPGAVTAGTGWVGVRCPAHPLARELLRAAGVPVVAPSANRFGHVSPTSAAHVLADLGAHDLTILEPSSSITNGDKGDGQNGVADAAAPLCRIGIESTVAKVDAAGGVITILRAGAVTASQLQKCLAAHGIGGVDVRVLQRRAPTAAVGGEGANGGKEEGASVLVEPEGPQVSPGQAITHYAPDRPCFLLAPQQLQLADAAAEWVTVLARRAVVLDVGGRLRGVEGTAAHYRDLSPGGDVREAAAGLFEALRWAESVGASDAGLRVLVVDLRAAGDALPSQDDREFAAALIDRILRAASGREAGPYLLKEE